MRPINQLLQIMLDNPQFLKGGLCACILKLKWNAKIVFEEWVMLYRYIKNNRPSKYSGLHAWVYRNSNYYWFPYSNRPRIKWLKKHIKRTSPQIY